MSVAIARPLLRSRLLLGGIVVGAQIAIVFVVVIIGHLGDKMRADVSDNCQRIVASSPPVFTSTPSSANFFLYSFNFASWSERRMSRSSCSFWTDSDVAESCSIFVRCSDLSCSSSFIRVSQFVTFSDNRSFSSCAMFDRFSVTSCLLCFVHGRDDDSCNKPSI